MLSTSYGEEARLRESAKTNQMLPYWLGFTSNLDRELDIPPQHQVTRLAIMNVCSLRPSGFGDVIAIGPIETTPKTQIMSEIGFSAPRR